MSVDAQTKDLLQRHRLPWVALDQLTRGPADAEAVRRLYEVERSHRLTLLRATVDKVSEELTDSPLGTMDVAWAMLGQVETAAPKVFERVLMHPYTGSWLAYTYRLVTCQATSDCPLWIHAGYLHCLAASAAAQAGIAFEIRVPVWNGEAILPTLGMARFAKGDVAEARGNGSEVELSVGPELVRVAEDTSGWLAVQEFHTDGLTVRLDDVDPYRGLSAPVPAKRIDDDEMRLWEELLDDAWRLIRECIPDFGDGLAAGLYSIVPRPPVPFRNMSGSTENAFGSMTISRPPDAASLASVLVHEFSHIRLYGLLRFRPLHDMDTRQRFRTLWRDDPRPVGGVLHGVYSFFGVTAFWRAFVEKYPENRQAMFELAYWRLGVWDTLQALYDDLSLTATGRTFVRAIADELRPWLKELVPEDIGQLAETAVTDHYAGWRLRHISPHETIVTALANAWLASEDAVKTVAPPVVPNRRRTRTESGPAPAWISFALPSPSRRAANCRTCGRRCQARPGPMPPLSRVTYPALPLRIGPNSSGIRTTRPPGSASALR